MQLARFEVAGHDRAARVAADERRVIALDAEAAVAFVVVVARAAALLEQRLHDVEIRIGSRDARRRRSGGAAPISERRNDGAYSPQIRRAVRRLPP